MREGRPFTIYTNHKPLTFALDQETLKAANSTSLQSRYMEMQGEKVVLPR